MSAQTARKIGIVIRVQLHAGQISFTDGGNNFVEARIHEDPITLYIAWQMRRDGAHLIHGDPTRTGGKKEADGAGSAARGVLCISKAGGSTYFDPHIFVA